MDIKLADLDKDLQITNGDLVLVRNADATAQFIGQKLKFFLAEWFLDESLGIDYFDSVFIKNPDNVVLSNIFKNEILSTPGVVELQAFDLLLDTETRILTITFRARAQDGIIEFDEEIEV